MFNFIERVSIDYFSPYLLREQGLRGTLIAFDEKVFLSHLLIYLFSLIFEYTSSITGDESLPIPYHYISVFPALNEILYNSSKEKTILLLLRPKYICEKKHYIGIYTILSFYAELRWPTLHMRSSTLC